MKDSFLERRVLVRPCVRTNGFASMRTVRMGSDFDGAFAQYVKAPASEVFPVESEKVQQLRALGAHRVIARGEPLIEQVGEESVDLVVDNVAGEALPENIRLIRRGGRYVSSGAIAGPLATMDLRTIYLRDLTLIGTTAWDEPVFPSLIENVERGEIRPQVAHTFPLAEIAAAQREFALRRHVGKLVLIPPQP